MSTTIWVLTIYLFGVPVYEERDAQWSTYRECMNRGWELARDYQKDHLIVIPICTVDEGT